MKKLLMGMSLAIVFHFTMGAVTLNVKVPEGTKKCFVCGDFNGWNVGSAPAMLPSGDRMFTLDLTDIDENGLSAGYKYLCGPDWLFVEKDAAGGEVSNRTKPSDPDVVESWRTMPEWSVETADLTINGFPRQLKIYLPAGYEESDESYPVIYYNCVQQRYDNAGDDSDNGDYFFGPMSWNAQDTMEQLRKEGSPAYIMVQINSFLAENTLSEHPDFAGTGQIEAYDKAFMEELIPYMESHWRVNNNDGKSMIVGADYGALYALYASVAHPEKFSTCVMMSPMLWINKTDFNELALKANADQTYYISAGSLEPEWMKSDASSLATAIESSEALCHYTVYNDAFHNDTSWGDSFASVLKAVSDGTAPADQPRKAAPAVIAETDFENAVYTLYAGDDKNNLKKIGTLTYTDEYLKKGSSTPVRAQIITYDIPVAYKSKYYWNIACGPDNSYPWLLSTPGNIGFSSKKSETSWHNIALFEDGSNQNIAAHSKGFRVVTSKESILMSQNGNHTSKATVKFPGEDKSFTIHFGSVNSASDMGAMTHTISVSDNCIEAEIIYDFEMNRVTVNETGFGENLDKINITSFSAVPSTTTVGNDVKVTLLLNGDCDVVLDATRNSNENLGLTFIKNAPGNYSLDLNDTKEGLYTLSVSFIAGENRLEDVGSINIRVLPSAEPAQNEITVNAYKDINWTETGRYKANFHTHTSRSFDTQYNTTCVVDRYHNVGYEILALTDHDANPYPWSMFDLYTKGAEARYAENLGMLAIPGCEISKDRRNNWSESTGGEFNHHTDLFTGRNGQEFMSLRESYAYTEALGGLQIINHPGQYWNLSTEYSNGAKNSPEWHAENFELYSSLVGLEVYNQGNRRPNDRVLWDQILTLTMPDRPVWGFSCDDTHTDEQYFRNYQYMLMPELSAEALKDAMKNGHTVFSYEYTGSGEARAPHVSSIIVDEENHTITVNSEDAEKTQWISSFHRTGKSAGSTTNTIVGMGKTFDYTGFRGSYVRALLTNKYGETATQPFGFANKHGLDVKTNDVASDDKFSVDYTDKIVTVSCPEGLQRISVFNAAGIIIKYIECNGNSRVTFSTENFEKGAYILVAAGNSIAYTHKFMAD